MIPSLDMWRRETDERQIHNVVRGEEKRETKGETERDTKRKKTTAQLV